MKHLKNQLKLKISNNPLLKGLLIVGSGTTISQGMLVITAPIITKLFTPSEFGVYAVFTSISSIMVVAASLRYELAIPLPTEKKKAVNIMALCFFLTNFSGLVFLFLLLFFHKDLFSIFHLESINNYFLLLIAAFFVSSMYQMLNYWAIRERDYIIITKTRILMNVSNSGLKIIMGLIKTGVFGLIFGEICSQVVGTFTIFKKIWKTEKQIITQNVSLANMREVAEEYLHFPLYSFPAAVLNVVSLQIPVFMLSFRFGLQTVGWFSLSSTVLILPGSLIANSLGQVYFGEISNNIREKKGDLFFLYQSTTKKLLQIGIFLIGIPAIIAPIFFPVLFGEVWREAGWYCYPLAIMVIASFCTSATSNLNTYGFNNWQFVWDITRVIFVGLGFLLAIYCNFSALMTLTVYGLILTIMYITLYRLNVSAIKKLMA